MGVPVLRQDRRGLAGRTAHDLGVELIRMAQAEHENAAVAAVRRRQVVRVLGLAAQRFALDEPPKRLPVRLGRDLAELRFGLLEDGQDQARIVFECSVCGFNDV